MHIPDVVCTSTKAANPQIGKSEVVVFVLMFGGKVEHHCACFLKMVPVFLQFFACGYLVKAPVYQSESQWCWNSPKRPSDRNWFQPFCTESSRRHRYIWAAFFLPFQNGQSACVSFDAGDIFVFSLWRWRFEESLPNMYSEPFECWSFQAQKICYVSQHDYTLYWAALFVGFLFHLNIISQQRLEIMADVCVCIYFPALIPLGTHSIVSS